MELKIVNGDYALERGRVVPLEGAQRLAQQLTLALATRRGSLPFRPDFGSRLALLLREKPSGRAALARGLVQEAVAQFEEITLEEVTLREQAEGKLTLEAAFRWQGESVTAAVAVE